MTTSDDTARDPSRPITLLICALGGEGGGVLAEWLVATATRCGFAAQSTSIPGVAQRTGATTYYIEVFPVPLAELGGRRPVFSLYPVPGALDALVSSELVETVRQIGNGMVSPDRTLVVSSSQRTLTTYEKIQLADGRASTADLLKSVQRFARESRTFDMAAAAAEAGTVMSAVLFGAIAGTGILPFAREEFETTVGGGGRGVEASLRGFALAYHIVRGAPQHLPAAAIPRAQAAVKEGEIGAFPPATQEIVVAGHERTREYQDAAYSAWYLERMKRVMAAERGMDPHGVRGAAITRETARYLALWMAFDDIVRVAALKCRASRYARVRGEVKAADGEIVRLYDHFKPGIPEFAALLPEKWAARLLRWDRRRRQKGKAAFALPIKLAAHTVSGFLALRLLASLKWLRRRGSRFAQEQAMIERWLAVVEESTRQDWELGHEIALCGRLIKGYGNTNDRGKENMLHVLEHLATGGNFATPQARAQAIRAARTAALADDAGAQFDQALVRHGAPARPLKAQPIRWTKKPSRVNA